MKRFSMPENLERQASVGGGLDLVTSKRSVARPVEFYYLPVWPHDMQWQPVADIRVRKTGYGHTPLQ